MADEEIRIVAGVPTDEELAAIVGVLMLRSAAPAPDEAEAPTRWSASTRPAYAYRDGRLTRPGPTAWRASGLPR